MRHQVQKNHPIIGLRLLVVLISGLIVAGCEKLDLEPEPFEYPLSLTVERSRSVNLLNWTEATVSTFEEYIILRSTEEIPDNPEPEVNGVTAVIARIDQRTATSFEDVNAPVADTVYYKVYARIGERMLMSPTISHDQHLLLINMRSDRAVGLPLQGRLIGIDRAIDVLYLYDYVNGEMIKTRTGVEINNPLMEYNAGSNELMVVDNSTIIFYDATTLETKQTIFPGQVREAKFSEDWIYFQRSQFPYGMVLYSRSTQSVRDEISVIQTDWRKFFVDIVQESPFKAEIFDFGNIGSAKYTHTLSNLDLSLSNQQPGQGSPVAGAKHPMRQEFVVTNAGSVINSELNEIDIVGNGSFNFSSFAYSPDGKYLYGLSFINSPVLIVFDAENEYGFVEEHVLSNQISPHLMFTDADNLYLISQVFLISSQKTLITVIPHP